MHHFSLKEISEWANTETVRLPNIQRSFVWKPHQIENLWDSIIRRFPLGSFVFSKGESGKLELLDGQQRATAICLGFGTEAFRDVSRYRVFIDLEPLVNNPNRRFNVRVINRSHPWGYSKLDNTKTLKRANIRQAQNLYPEDANLQEDDLFSFFPMEAECPIPLSWMIHAKSVDELKKKLHEWNAFEGILYRWTEQHQKTEEDFESKLQVIYKQIQTAIQHQRIPALYLELNDEPDSFQQAEDETEDEVETMFIRLNAGGTPLTGEELNYSILKSSLDPAIQERIELACKSLFRPARFITIVYRLFQQEQKKEEADGLTMRIKPKQFQRSMKDKREAFVPYLKQVTQEKSVEGLTLLEYTKSILEYTNDHSYGLPYLIYHNLSDAAPELMFLLLYRVKIMGDRFAWNNQTHRRMLGMITIMMWFGKGEKQRDHRILLRNIWLLAQSAKKDDFWSWITVQRGQIDGALTPLVPFNEEGGLIDIPKIAKRIKSDSDIFQKYTHPKGVPGWLHRIMHKRDILYYAQRVFLETYFDVKDYQLEDTNRPFDMDHIFPENWKRGLSTFVQNVYQSIGNLRAWPYAFNRMDSDKSPAAKFNPLGEPEAPREKWLAFIAQHPRLGVHHLNELSDKLLEWSFCVGENQNWLDFEGNILKENWKESGMLIIQRNLEILKEWYSNLEIDSLIKSAEIDFKMPFDKRIWQQLPSGNGQIDEPFEGYPLAMITSPLSIIQDINIHFYLIAHELEEEQSHQILKEDNIHIGLWIKNNFNTLYPILKKDDSVHAAPDLEFISKSFTLKTPDKNGLYMLIQDILQWLENLSTDTKTNTEIAEAFIATLRKDYRDIGLGAK